MESSHEVLDNYQYVLRGLLRFDDGRAFRIVGASRALFAANPRLGSDGQRSPRAFPDRTALSRAARAGLNQNSYPDCSDPDRLHSAPVSWSGIVREAGAVAFLPVSEAPNARAASTRSARGAASAYLPWP